MASKLSNAGKDCGEGFQPCNTDWKALKAASVVCEEDSCSHGIKPLVDIEEDVCIEFPSVKKSKEIVEENNTLRKEDIEYRNKMEAKRIRKDDPYAKVVKTVPFGFI